MPERPAPAVAVAASNAEVLANVGAAMAELAAAFQIAGIDTARRDSRLLVAHATNLSTAQVLAHPEHLLDAAARETLLQLRTRRLRREPISRIISEREFWGQRFEISPAVLDPRADSETIVDAVLKIVAAEGLSHSPIRLLDAGTGSGCLLLALLQELPHAFGIGSDISQPALDIARRNAARLGLESRAKFACIDALDGLIGPFDVVVSNPPYIRTAEIPHLAPEIRGYDPTLALDGGPDGLNIYRRIIARLRHVVPAGWVVMETGADQARDVVNLLTAAGFIARNEDARIYPDLAGHNRCVAVKAR